jgi:hypothetical protein
VKGQSATLDQIRRAGIEALARELGPTGMIRFLQQYEPGAGDYTAEKSTRRGKTTVKELTRRIHQNRRQGRRSARLGK